MQKHKDTNFLSLEISNFYLCIAKKTFPLVQLVNQNTISSYRQFKRQYLCVFIATTLREMISSKLVQIVIKKSFYKCYKKGKLKEKKKGGKK